jgi:hypothetical protein
MWRRGRPGGLAELAVRVRRPAGFGSRAAASSDSDSPAFPATPSLRTRARDADQIMMNLPVKCSPSQVQVPGQLDSLECEGPPVPGPGFRVGGALLARGPAGGGPPAGDTDDDLGRRS